MNCLIKAVVFCFMLTCCVGQYRSFGSEKWPPEILENSTLNMAIRKFKLNPLASNKEFDFRIRIIEYSGWGGFVFTVGLSSLSNGGSLIVANASSEAGSKIAIFRKVLNFDEAKRIEKLVSRLNLNESKAKGGRGSDVTGIDSGELLVEIAKSESYHYALLSGSSPNISNSRLKELLSLLYAMYRERS